MNEQITKIFKPVLDSNDNLKRLLCGDKNILDGRSFEDLCGMEYIVDEMSADNVASMGAGKSSMLMFAVDEGVFGSKYVHLQIVCRHDSIYMGNEKLRHLEIVSEFSEAIHQKVDFEGGVLELETFSTVPVNDDICVYIASFRTNSDEIKEKTEPKILTFYRKRLFNALKSTFAYNEVGDSLYIDGVSGSEMSLDELIKKGYVRMSPMTFANYAKKNIYAFLQINHTNGTELSVNVIGSCTDGDMELMKAELGMAASLIAVKMSSNNGVVLTSDGLNELSNNIAAAALQFSMDATKEDIERIENRNKIDIRFFAGVDVLQAVPSFDIKVGGQRAGIAVDLLDGPYRLTFSNKEILEFGFHMRYTFGVDENPAFKVTMKSDGAEPEISSGREFDEQSYGMLMSMYQCMANLSEFLNNAAITDQFAEMDVENEGILLYLEKGEVKFKRVSGEQRPDLPCNNMGNIEMGRPYADEINETMSNVIDNADELVSAAGIPINKMIEGAEAGDVEMIEALTKIYAEGEKNIFDENLGEFVSIAPDPAKEIFWNEKGAEFGHAESMFNLGIFHAKEIGVERDFARAAEWMKKAEEAGYTEAGQYAENFENMVKWIPMAEAGDAEAQGLAAKEYIALGGVLNGRGGDNVYAEAIKYAEMAQGNDKGNAYFVLGLAYEHGRGVEMDKMKAAEYYKKGADIGHMISTNNYGLLHVMGDGVPMNRQVGFEYFLKAAEMGYGLAMQNVAMCYESGDGTEFNLEKALEWYEKSLAVLPDEQVEFKVRMMKEYLDMQ